MNERVWNGFVKVDKVETPQGPREVVRTTNAVAMLIFDSVNDRVLFVNQFRAPMVSDDNPQGFITEVAAGRFDEEIGVAQLVVKEVKQELGVEIDYRDVTIINHLCPLATSPGVLSEKIYLAYARVHAQKIDTSSEKFGSSVEGEETKRVFVKVSDLKAMVFEDLKTFALVQWFLLNIHSD